MTKPRLVTDHLVHVMSEGDCKWRDFFSAVNWDVFFLAGGSMTSILLDQNVFDLFLITRDPEVAKHQFKKSHPPVQIILRHLWSDYDGDGDAFI